ncbi:MAG: hypothetical protein ACYCUI_15025 [Vulcanimicrobiaceae bacterium]
MQNDVLKGIVDNAGPITYGTVREENNHYDVTWRQTAPGPVLPNDEIKGLKLIATYRVDNWNVSLHATNSQAQAIAKVPSNLASLLASNEKKTTTLGITTRNVQFKAVIEHLRALSRYLLGTNLPSVKAEMMVVPSTAGYRVIGQKSLTGAVPIKVIMRLPMPTDAATPKVVDEVNALFEAAGNLGYFVAKAKTAKKSGNQLSANAEWMVKSEADAECWQLAVRPSLAAGLPIRVKSGGELPRGLIPAFAALHRQSPNNVAVLKVYALLLLVSNARSFLTYINEPWPYQGTDIEGLNAVLGFCKYFIHYKGDIETAHLSPRKVKFSPFFHKSGNPWTQ